MIKQSIANDILKLLFAQLDKLDILPNTCYIGLSTTEPDSNGGNFTEPSVDNGYKRYLLGQRSASLTWKMSTPENGGIYNSETLFFPKATSDWGSVTHFGLFSSVSGGTPVFWGPLIEPVSVLENYVAIFSPEQFKITLS